ncbi:MAG TPA: class I SAM-dependent methyltransferase [Ktedonosporobacter sp.]|jgi:ubiquinone/menaquinone biosynthesis C-methylase UbiE|nr:class I SAM-dependent methyltransferase [Ktedonosporobacter sp.]
MSPWFFKRPSRNKVITPSATASPQKGAPGRRFREDVPYALPKDLEEGQRLNFQHYIIRYILRGTHAVPLDQSVKNILDVGSGTGIWGHEMAQAFPLARVYGLDLEPPQTVSLAAPAISVPDNYHFIQGNVLKGLPFPDNMFDYVHQRLLFLGVPQNSWPAVIKELSRVTRPGGWVEIYEADILFPDAGPATRELNSWTSRFMGMRGVDTTQMRQLGNLLKRQGLRNVIAHTFEVPLGSWDRLGQLLEKDYLSGIRALKEPACAALKLSPQKYEQVLLTASKEWAQTCATYRHYLAYGQA